MIDLPGETHVLILAAGFSERMGAFKPLLPLGDSNPLRRLIRLYRRAGLARIHVVGGHRADEVEAEARREGADFIRNPAPEDGMFSSVATGVGKLPPDAHRVFVHPVDIPLVRADTIELLLREASISAVPVLVPYYQNRPGHPPLIGREALAAIPHSDGAGGLRAVLERFGPAAVETADRNILFDIDTPAEYAGANDRLANPAGLEAEEARALLRLYFRPPPRLAAHAAMVAAVSGIMARALADAGAPIDGNLALCGAWLHDIAKGQPEHHQIGAWKLREMGFDAVADIVETHARRSWPEGEQFDERQLVALADKLVKGDQPVGLDRRFAEKLAAYAGDPAAVAAIRERWRDACLLAARFETLARRSVADICREARAF